MRLLASIHGITGPNIFIPDTNGRTSFISDTASPGICDITDSFIGDIIGLDISGITGSNIWHIDCGLGDITGPDIGDITGSDTGDITGSDIGDITGPDIFAIASKEGLK